MRRGAAGLIDRLRTVFTFERIFFLILAASPSSSVSTAWISSSSTTTRQSMPGSPIRLLHEGIWTYDPSYHGPLLYYITAGMFWIFGDGDLVGEDRPFAPGDPHRRPRLPPLPHGVPGQAPDTRRGTLSCHLAGSRVLLPVPQARYLHALLHHAPPRHPPRVHRDRQPVVRPRGRNRCGRRDDLQGGVPRHPPHLCDLLHLCRVEGQDPFPHPVERGYSPSSPP